MTSSRKVRTAVCISGRGSNMAALIKNSQETPDFPARICLVIADRPEAEGLEYARQSGIDTQIIDYHSCRDRREFERQLDLTLRNASVELLCLAGFMRLLTADFIHGWGNAILNIHPALLPAFKGLDTHSQVIKSGVRISGCTVHVVRPEMDSGPIIAQVAVPVLPTDTPDTLAARILRQEHKLYPNALRMVASRQVTVEGNTIIYHKNLGIPDRKTVDNDLSALVSPLPFTSKPAQDVDP